MVENETQNIAAREILDIPFFTLEYNAEKACFLRKIPWDAKDLGGGRFSWNNRILSLPPGAWETSVLGQREIRGKELLALIRRYSPLIKSGPLPAEQEDRLMELGLPESPPAAGENRAKSRAKEDAHTLHTREIIVALYYGKIPREAWLRLEGLPNHRLYNNRVYEIIPEEFISLFSLEPKAPFEPGQRLGTLPLRGAAIPAFADDHARLIYVFASAALYKLLSQNSVFIEPGQNPGTRPHSRQGEAQKPEGPQLSLVFSCSPVMEKGIGKLLCSPALKYENQLFSAQALSRHFHQKYFPLKNRWIRRETLERVAIGPLGRFINGEPLEPFRLRAADFFAPNSKVQKLLSLAEYSDGLEPAQEDREPWFRWQRSGSEDELFARHLDFLRRWGFSGAVITRREKTAPLLENWLYALEDEPQILALLPEDLLSPALFRKNPELRGISLIPYDSRGDKKFIVPKNQTWNIMIAGGLNELQDTAFLGELKKIRCSLRLGIFFDNSGTSGAPRFAENPIPGEVKRFFIGTNSGDHEKYLIRGTGDFYDLPKLPSPLPGPLQRPPKPWPDPGPLGEPPGSANPENAFVFGGGRFFINAKYQGIPAAKISAEQAEFRVGQKTGRPVEQSPFIYIEETVNYDQLTEPEKRYFHYWRSEFRRGRIRESAPAYVLLYARELLLGMEAGSNKDHAGLVQELCRLSAAYQELFPEAAPIPRWILDFVILNRVTENISPLFDLAAQNKNQGLIKKPGPADDSLLTDLYLHRKYVEENNSLRAADFLPLLDPGPKSGLAKPDRLYLAEIEKALNNADRTLRKTYGKKLLELFYPVPAEQADFVCYQGLADMGRSAYTGQWLSYSRHKPFTTFLSSLTRFLARRSGEDLSPRKTAPTLEPVWKYLSGLSETVPAEMAALFEKPEASSLVLETEKLSRLRRESDAVLELLRIENQAEPETIPEPRAEPETEAAPAATDTSKNNGPQDLRRFIAGLEPPLPEGLDLITQKKTGELDNLARLHHTMTELLIDEINQRFLREYGDLLIQTKLDEGPEIEEEYKDEVIWALTFRNA